MGLSIATLLSQHHKVMAVDIIPEKVELINNRKSPIQDEYIEKYLAKKDLDLTATLDAKEAYTDADFVIIAAPTNYDSKKNFLPVYDVARDGSFALSLDFSRLHRMRPGYGYSNLPESTKGELCPDKTCIWKMDIPSGKIKDLFKYTDMAAFEPDESMQAAEHKVNHLMISPNGKRFMVLHRWFQKGRKHTRLVTVNVDKTEMYNLSDIRI